MEKTSQRRQLPFKPTDEELNFIEEHQIGWSEFCHNTLEKIMKDDHTETKKNKIQNYSMYLMFLFIGILFLTSTYNAPGVISWGTLFFMGFGIIIFGIVGIYNEVKNGRKQHRG